MKPRPYRLQEVLIKDFRCFRADRTVSLAPLTLLLGENSTGKTSFLAALRLVWDAAYRKTEPNFRKFPFDLGAFSEIAYNLGTIRHRADSFEFGFTTISDADTPLGFSAKFIERDGAPFPEIVSWRNSQVWIRRWASIDGNTYIEFGTSGGSWRLIDPKKRFEVSPLEFVLPVVVWAGLAARGGDSPFGRIQPLDGSPEFPTEKDLDSLLFELEEFPTYVLEKRPFASAPTQSSPQRIYDRIGGSSGEESQTAIYLADQYMNKIQWTTLKERLEEFGRNSGLFDDISVRVLEQSAGSPFQLQIRKHTTNSRKGPRRNLIDVGYGVSQALPLVVELFRADGPYTFLIQQPEVHLHPSAQAALGSLFCESVASGRQLIVETHSEYIVDRVRMDIRDRQTALKPDDVSILFFERSDLDVRIHSLRFDDQGNVLGAPDGYGQFFMDEARRSVGL